MKFNVMYLLLMLAVLLNAQTRRSGIDNIVKDEMAKQELVGVAVGVVENGRITHLKAYGYSDLDKKIKLTTNTGIRWASISKTLTAVAAFQLIDQGKMKLNDKVTKHLSSSIWPNTGNKKDITIAHLLQNRSGINHYGRDKSNKDISDKSSIKKYSGKKAMYDHDKSVEIFKTPKLLFDPGTDYRYSTYGYNLLGAVIEEVAPDGYVKWINNNIKNPLGLSSLAPSFYDWSGYRRTCEGLEKLTTGSKSSVLPGGGWMSNVEDLTKFMQALMKGKLITSQKKMLENMNSERYDSYGYGMEIVNRCSTAYGHGGTHDNVLTQMYFYPRNNDGIVVMINGSQGNNRPDGSKNLGRVQLFNRIAKKIGISCGTIPSETANPICGKETNCSKKIAMAWRKSNNDVLIRRGYTYNGFSKVWSDLQSIGYRCTDIETYIKGGIRYWDGLFSKGYSKSMMWRGMSKIKFLSERKKLHARGYRLVDVETYGVGNNRKWNAIYLNGSGKSAIYTDRNTKAFYDKRNELAKQGYKLIDIEAYQEAGELKWVGVWRAGTDIKYNYNKSHNDFSKIHFNYEKKGYKLMDVETYKVGQKRYWAGVWEKSRLSQKINRNLNYCDILKKNNTWEKQGYELIDLESY